MFKAMQIMLGDAPGVVIDRNVEFDLIEAFVNDPDVRKEIVDSIHEGKHWSWQAWARRAGLSDERIDEVIETWDNLDEIVVVCVQAVMDAGDKPINVRPGVAHKFCVVVDRDEDEVVLTVCRPQDTLVVR